MDNDTKKRLATTRASGAEDRFWVKPVLHLAACIGIGVVVVLGDFFLF